MAEFGRHPGRSGLRIPVAELRQIDAARLLHRADEILARHRLTIVPIEIKVRALTEVFRPKQRPHHADDLGPLVVRSAERRVGKECVSTCRSRWSPYHYKTKTLKHK